MPAQAKHGRSHPVAFRDKEKPVMVRESNITAGKGVSQRSKIVYKFVPLSDCIWESIFARYVELCGRVMPTLSIYETVLMQQMQTNAQ